LVVVEAAFSDGMEYDVLYYLGSEYFASYAGHPQGYLTAIAAHETAHQWWYGLVGNDQAVEPWLDEALAIYSALLFCEGAYPELVPWWWGFRVTRFNPSGWVNSTVYEHSGFRPYINAVYLRGAMFIQDLRNQMGDELFYAFLREYARRGTHHEVTGDDFFSHLAEHLTADWGTLMHTYFDPAE
jgi:aminopeptidase N